MAFVPGEIPMQAVFLGTEAFPAAEQLKSRLAALGMSFGADSNAFTDFRQTVYTLNCCLDPGGAAAAAAADEVCAAQVHSRSFGATSPGARVN
jgi:hypothetical protein